MAKLGDLRRYNGENNREKENCPQGHPLMGDNLLTADLKRGRRGCKICSYERIEAARKAKREARDAR